MSRWESLIFFFQKCYEVWKIIAQNEKNQNSVFFFVFFSSYFQVLYWMIDLMILKVPLLFENLPRGSWSWKKKTQKKHLILRTKRFKILNQGFAFFANFEKTRFKKIETSSSNLQMCVLIFRLINWKWSSTSKSVENTPWVSKAEISCYFDYNLDFTFVG